MAIPVNQTISAVKGDRTRLHLQWTENGAPKPGAGSWTLTGSVKRSRSASTVIGTLECSWHDTDEAIAEVVLPADLDLPTGNMSCVYDVQADDGLNGPVTLATGFVNVTTDVTP